MKCRKRNAQKFDVNVSQKTIYLIKLRLIITFIDFFFLSQFKIDYICTIKKIFNQMKTLYIIAGCNGAGKTTASLTMLPEIWKCREFVNADEIAKGLSPYNPEGVAIEAGRLMLKRIDYLFIVFLASYPRNSYRASGSACVRGWSQYPNRCNQTTLSSRN